MEPREASTLRERGVHVRPLADGCSAAICARSERRAAQLRDAEAGCWGDKVTSSETEQAQAPKRDLSYPQGLAQAQWL